MSEHPADQPPAPDGPAGRARPASPLGLSLPDGAGRRVLVTGATGYVGGRLVPELLAAGFTVRATARHVEDLSSRDWYDDVERAEADLQDPDEVRAAMRDVHTVLYLVHSMGSGEDFVERERSIAETVAAAAAEEGVEQVVFLGGLHPDKPLEELSEHMRSREQVARVLLAGPVPALVFEAGIIIGSGSVSFEMIRHLAERLPLMPGPRWLDNRVEPIAIRDVLYYLAHASALAEPVNRAFDIGCGRAQPFKEMLSDYAEVAGLSQRRIITTPLPAQRLSGFWISMVTPIPRGIAMPLAASMAEDAVTEEHDITALVPDPPGGLTSYREACRRAIARQFSGTLESTWDDDVLAARDPADPLPSDPEWAGHTVFTDVRQRDGDASPEAVWRAIESIGGTTGWYSTPALWRIRGVMDQALGGYGMARGRRDPGRLRVNDHVDWWRVESIDPGRLLTLRAEMRTGGRAWLQLGVSPREGGGSCYRQRAVFIPQGILGRMYWRAILPFHALVFPEMARNILAAAERLESGAAGTGASPDASPAGTTGEASPAEGVAPAAGEGAGR
ncbi:SDR family oxidoreductase [Citricoccus sp. SGAir0253]|uniref:SDR family oxidoreductase n=1 Tax=Citricoccus sp. SGAir0253 TaxID=2567881 RepID=UPI0010CD2A35|nr:SDR family oxidoreductase [Citricoccus sp. SGAir0253]QCU77668.1 SDR family oxidoreductase [Citricoccus sp. SGAir0253]